MKNGYTLLEVVVVVAILSILSVFSMINIIEFQKSSVIDSAAKELASTAESARSSSIAGLVIPGTDQNDYELNFLPVYGVKIEPGKYSLIRKYRTSGDTTDTTDFLETVNLSSNITLSPTLEVLFERRTGETSGAYTITITQSGSSNSKQLIIKSDSTEIINL